MLSRVPNHFSQQTLAHMHAGRRAKIEWMREGEIYPCCRSYNLLGALRLHEGNIRIKGMISGSSAKVEKMYTLFGSRCAECDTVNELLDYRDSRPRFAYEIPRIDLNKVKLV